MSRDHVHALFGQHLADKISILRSAGHEGGLAFKVFHLFSCRLKIKQYFDAGFCSSSLVISAAGYMNQSKQSTLPIPDL